jgi:hypothetical protein
VLFDYFKTKERKLWKSMYIFLCVFSIIANILVIGMDFQNSGWDFALYCSAVRAFNDNKDPYILGNLKTYSGSDNIFISNHIFIYPPLSLILLKPLCLLNSKIVYYILWIILLLTTFSIIRKLGNREDLLLITLLTTGFIASYWNFLTGNIGIIELFLFSIAYWSIVKERYHASSLTIALTAFFKIMPIAFSSLFIFVKKSYIERFKIIVLSFTLLITFYLVSYMLLPELTHSYYLSMTGNLKGQPNPTTLLALDTGPTFYFLIRDVLKSFNLNEPIYLLILSIVFISFVGLALFFYYKRENTFLRIFSFGVISILIILPRLKEYSFMLALIPLYFLIKDYNFKVKSFSIFVISVLPLISKLTLQSSIFVKENIIFEYSQFICLFIIFICILILDTMLHKSPNDTSIN